MANSSYTVEAVLKARDSGFSSAFKAAERSVSGLSNMASKVGSTFKSVLGANLISSALTSGIGSITSGIGSMVGELNGAQKAWKTFEGNLQAFGRSAETISQAKKEMQDFATKTIYSASDMASTYSQLDAVGTKNVGSLVKAFGGLAASAENPAQAMKSLSTQATQMASKPKVAWMDFKIMMEQAPAGMAAVAKEMGMSTAELVSAVQDGKVNTEEFFDALNKAGNSDAFQKMATEFKTVDQAIDGMKESLSNKLMPAFEQLNKFGIKAVNALSDAFDKIDFNKLADGLGKALDKIDFTKIINNVSAFISDTTQKIQTFWTAFSNTGAVSAFTTAVQSISAALGNIWNSLTATGVLEILGSTLGTLVKWLSQIATAAANFIASLPPGVIQAIAGAIGAFAVSMFAVSKGVKVLTFIKSFNPFAAFRQNAASGLGGASSVVSSGVSKIAQIFKSVGFAIKAALSGVSQVILAFGAALKTAGVANILAFGGAVAIAAVGIGAGVAIIAAGFALLATQSQGVAIIINAVGQAFSAVATAIIGAFAQAIVTVAGVLPIVTSALANLAPLIIAVGIAVGQAAPFVTALGQALSSIISVLPPVITALSEGAAAIISALTPIVEIVGNVFTNIAQIVADAIVRIVQALSPFMPAVSEMVQALAPVLQSIVEAFTTLVSQISPIIDSIANLFKSLGESIKTVLDGAKGVIESFGGAVRNILDGISGIFDAIGNAALNAGKGFKLMAEGVVMITKTNLGDMAASLAAVATGIGAIAANGAGIATAGNGMKALGQGMAMVQAYSAGASASLMSVSAVLPALASGFSALAPIVASAMARAVASVQSGMTLIVTVIVSSAARMTAAGQQAGQGVSRGIVNGIRAGVGQATAAMNNLMLSVQRVGNIGARNMLSVGAQIGNGLARGMIAALPAVTSAANALVSQAERAARAAADIHSPSRLFRDNVGIYIGQGIAVGIDRSQKYVNEALENLYDVKSKFDYSDLLDDGLKQHGYTANLNGSLTLENKQSDQKLDIIKDALNTIKQSLDREVVLNVNGQEFARLTGDDFSRYQSDRDYISNILKGVRV
jgi:phage protein|nr:MAG TPA: tail tape measure [Caudoviricetes sp.]